jgi:hypothetical protein
MASLKKKLTVCMIHILIYRLFHMIVVETGHAHVMKFLPLSCELSIFVAVTVIF